ncbi:helix-turn-helix domain-containing protein [Streptomyces coffeae]|uniref:helix-turn-helix domain-containing protein n=1 Tax=Streptomyces coffeae TaxID=621382 RepID=UPI0027DD8929|nr:helix-turn-helix domain-containing protein [Streptomyces coffeae]
MLECLRKRPASPPHITSPTPPGHIDDSLGLGAPHRRLGEILIHRTTLYYRLTQIENSTGWDLENGRTGSPCTWC